MNVLRINKNFRCFFAASCISVVGDFVDDIAFAQLVYEVTRSALLMSYVFIVKIIFMAVSIFFASLVDRSNKQKLLMFAGAGQGVLLTVVYVLFNAGYLTVPLLFVFVTLQAFFSSIMIPAKNALFTYIIDDEHAISARSLMNLVSSMLQIFAYMGAGVLIIYIGISNAILFDSLTFFAALVFIKKVRYTDISTDTWRVQGGFMADVREGFAFIKHERMIMSILTVTFFANAFTAPVESLMPAYFGQIGHSEIGYSVFMTGMSVGMIIGGWALTLLQRKTSAWSLFLGGMVLGAAGMGLLFFAAPYMSVVAALVIGLSYGIVNILNGTLIQRYTPREMIARIFSVFKCVSYMAGPAGAVISGWFGDLCGLRFVFLVFAIGFAVTVLLCGLFTPINGGETVR